MWPTDEGGELVLFIGLPFTLWFDVINMSIADVRPGDDPRLVFVRFDGVPYGDVLVLPFVCDCEFACDGEDEGKIGIANERANGPAGTEEEREESTEVSIE